MLDEVDRVARAFYDADDDAHAWESEPEILKDEFREYARRAIALLEQHEKRRLLETRTRKISKAA